MAKKVKADVIILDPLAEMHNVVENSNDHSKVVGAILRRVATETGAAVIFAAHSRKATNGAGVDGDPGNIHDLRGGGSLGGVVRIAYNITGMNETEARKCGVVVENRHQYVRLTIAKNNLGPTNKAPCWYKRVGVKMGPEGEEFEIGALIPQQFRNDEPAPEPIWLTIERIMMDYPDRFAIGRAYPTADIAKMLEGEANGRLKTRIALDMENWLKEGPVKQGDHYNLRAERVTFGRNHSAVRYTIMLEERDDDEETDFLS